MIPLNFTVKYCQPREFRLTGLSVLCICSYMLVWLNKRNQGNQHDTRNSNHQRERERENSQNLRMDKVENILKMLNAVNKIIMLHEDNCVWLYVPYNIFFFPISFLVKILIVEIDEKRYNSENRVFKKDLTYTGIITDLSATVKVRPWTEKRCLPVRSTEGQHNTAGGI